MMGDSPCSSAAELPALLRSHPGDFGKSHECLIWSQGITTADELIDGLSHQNLSVSHTPDIEPTFQM